ncbi:MAG TPA: pectinesterase family protein [Actinocrinis sp.]|uniref:pectinesterase family protein n=1 Tax=Actinocrinis sp. TaxID=1920516 RepID=UPI002DDD9C12|nr:pectinesterase family protein [Actinocrinis sp.]HEV2348189.1 pectinesterase family protein [Actinocrinis sp.]
MSRPQTLTAAASVASASCAALLLIAGPATAANTNTGDNSGTGNGNLSAVLLVAPPGTGLPPGLPAFNSIQAAVNSIRPAVHRQTKIIVSPGTYVGQVYIPADKTDVSIIGATGDPADVTIADDIAHGTYAANGNLYGTDCSATLTVAGNGFEADGITVANTFDRAADPAAAARGPQAVAVKAVADQAVFTHDDFTAVQDTLFASSYADNFQPQECFTEDGVAQPPATSPAVTAVAPPSRQYYADDTISGSIDFICGSATAVFDHDDIDIVGGHPGGSVTAPDTPTEFTHGYLITDSRIDNADGTLAAGADFLSRPWRHTGTSNPVAQMTIRGTYLGASISAAHYEDWSKPFFPWAQARYSEYDNNGPAADDVAADVPQLTDGQAASFTIQDYFGDWHPHP